MIQALVVLLSLFPLEPDPQEQEKALVPKPQPTGRNEELRQELLRRFKVDQDARMKLMAWMKDKNQTDLKKIKDMDTPEVKRLHQIDHENTARMKEILAKYGWPGKSLVGTDGANAAWLLVQHADDDRPFQKLCLNLMDNAARKGEVSKADLAYLTDRVLVGEKKKQRYGTQMQGQGGKWVPLPIEDEASVDKRRAEVGLQPLAEYIKLVEQMYQAPKKK
jgi:hypothetical protein